jgi:hypothetical protein
MLKEMKGKEEIKKSVKGKRNKKSKHEQRDSKPEVASKYNDDADLKNHSKYGNPNWYFTDHDLAEQASRFSFQSYIGNGKLIDTATLPSIATMYLHPSLGGYVGVTEDSDPSEDNMSVQAVNLMARKLYARLAAMSGRTSSYQPQDIMFAILGIGEVISIVSHLRRVIGLAFTYNYRNRDFPSHVIKALGVSPDDLFSNLAKYRVEFNTILNMANKIPILANVSWFAKCSSIYEAIFQDSPDEMAQMYIMVPGSTWIIDEQSSETGTILKTVPFCLNSMQDNVVAYKTFGDYLAILRDMINALLTSTTFNVIYSDILNLSAKENVPLMQLDLVSESYGVIPQYDEEVLLHIHNMGIYQPSYPDYFQNTKANLQGRSTSNCNDVFSDPDSNNIVYAPLFRVCDSSHLTDIAASLDQVSKIVKFADLVDFPYGNPDLTERLEATRFAMRLNPDEVSAGETGSDAWAYAKTLPDHYCSQMNIWINGTTANNNNYCIRSTLMESSMAALMLAQLIKFRYAPIIYRYNSDGSLAYVYGDLNYFTRLDGVWLKRLNSLCLQGLLELR